MNRNITIEEIKKCEKPIDDLRSSLSNVLYGQENLIDSIIMGLLSGGHVLLEGLPGLGKTELIKGLAACLGVSFRRIQFTPDLLPSDITGFQIFDAQGVEGKFRFEKGPLFSHLVLADEINRASPKTQAAMLEAMQEKGVTISGNTHKLPEPFFVMATQNPIELEGTYPLPEAQLDRFLFKLPISIGNKETMKKIIQNRDLGSHEMPKQCVSVEQLKNMIDVSRRIYLPDPVVNAISALVILAQPSDSGPGRWLKHGAGPRAGIALATALKAKALLSSRINASLEDLTELAPHILRHRLHLNPEARMEGKDSEGIVLELLNELTHEIEGLPRNIREMAI